MFDIGWMEMMVIAIVMIVIIGPKELPAVLHTMGRWIGRVRAMARSFQDSIEEMAQESGLDDVRREVDSLSNYDIGGAIENSIDPDAEIRKELARDGSEDPPDKKDGPKPSEKRTAAKKRKAKSRKPRTGEASAAPSAEPEGRPPSADETANAARDKP